MRTSTLSLALAAVVLSFTGGVIATPIEKVQGSVLASEEILYKRSNIVNVQPKFKREYGECTRPITGSEDLNIGFEFIRPECWQGDCLWKSFAVRSDRGWGKVFGENDPVIFPNYVNWTAINCNGWSGTPLEVACGGGNSEVALYSSGYATFYPPGEASNQKRLPRFGAPQFANDFLLFDLKSLAITPFVTNGASTSLAKVTIYGISPSGSVVAQQTFDVPNNKRTTITLSSSFAKLSAIDFSVGAQSGEGQPFAIDDLVTTKYNRGPLPSGCKPQPQPVPGPCKPEAKNSFVFTVGFDEIQYTSLLPLNYGQVEWASDSRHEVFNRSTVGSRFRPGAPLPPSAKNFVVARPLNILASTYDKRFGVKELHVLCHFPDAEDTRGKPCVVTFVGRRDPFDGAGLPVIVRASISIPNPGSFTGDRYFTKVNLETLTNSLGAFRRLTEFTAFTSVGPRADYAAYDSIVFTRDFDEGENCRASGVSTVNFDSLSKGLVPRQHASFVFGDNQWSVTPKSDYSSGQPGYIAAVSPPNSIRKNSAAGGSISSYTDITNNFLFDFESATITLDVSASDISRVIFLVQADDACGRDAWAIPYTETIPSLYSNTFQPAKVQFRFTRPYLAISSITFTAAFKDTGVTVGVFVDDFKYRKYTGPTPGCESCGYRGLGLCEVPYIIR